MKKRNFLKTLFASLVAFTTNLVGSTKTKEYTHGYVLLHNDGTTSKIDPDILVKCSQKLPYEFFTGMIVVDKSPSALGVLTNSYNDVLEEFLKKDRILPLYGFRFLSKDFYDYSQKWLMENKKTVFVYEKYKELKDFKDTTATINISMINLDKLDKSIQTKAKSLT